MALIRVWSGIAGELSRLVEVNPDGLVSELAATWGVSKQRVRRLLAQGRVSGVYKNPMTGQWEKPADFSEVKLKMGKRGPKPYKARSAYLF